MILRHGGRFNLSDKKARVLVTGASGFLGSWLCYHLNSKGYEVLAVTRPNKKIPRLERFPKSLVFACAESHWPSMIASLKPKVVIAADWSGVDSESRNLLEIQLKNVDRIERLADACITNNVETFITFGSHAENGPINIPAKELNYDNATTAYGKVKVELRKRLSEKLNHTSTRFIWGRIFNIYGALDNPIWFLPSLINSILDSKPFSMTSGNQVWSYLHAHDFCTAVNDLIESDTIKGVVNIGSEQTIIIRDIANYVAVTLNRESLLQFGSTNYRNDQVMILQPITSTLSYLGWKPSIDIYSGLEDLVNWHEVGNGKYTVENLYKS